MFPIIILAGGLATRLRPITEKIPKSLIEINGLPFVYHQLDLLEQKGFNKIHFCLGFLGELVEKAVRESEYFTRISISFSYDGGTLLGTGGTIRNIINQYSIQNIIDEYLKYPELMIALIAIEPSSRFCANMLSII